MIDTLRAIISFVFVLGVLVFIHELGHYLAARWRGVHVDVFSIGFGKPLYRWYDKVGTEWRICPIPLGGYVKPHGFADPEDVTEEERAAYIPGKTFYGKSVGSRAIVIAAGPIFNFLLAIILFTGLFAISGTPQPEVKPVIQAVVSQSAADKAGLKPEDIIVKIDQIDHPTSKQMIDFVGAHPNFTTNLVVQRNGKDIDLPITIAAVSNEGKTIGQVGVQFSVATAFKNPLPFGQAFVAAVKDTWRISKQIIVNLSELVTGQHSVKELGGPIKIAQMSGQVAHDGFSGLVAFMALLSINLGLLNLFPIPVLDGGRLVFYLVEAVIRKPVPKKIQAISFQMGFALIFLLFLFTTYNDIAQLGFIRQLMGK